MSYGLLAFLDDVAALAKMAAASVDDIAAQSLKAGSSSIGIVIDDAAVTPSYVTDISPARELPAIFRIARWSIFNKLVIIMPAALLLAQFAPWIITPLLTVGGLYLAFEGAEKVLEIRRLLLLGCVLIKQHVRDEKDLDHLCALGLLTESEKKSLNAVVTIADGPLADGKKDRYPSKARPTFAFQQASLINHSLMKGKHFVRYQPGS